ncbi:MAG TPA: glycoside hydrolase family 3 C-terminal domain-containing protein, partial [Polyangiaceae bacterium]|nr:glycoside hydrolase family 3 C-terminal domain-containing protein [Polyangiaceae bacterium]
MADSQPPDDLINTTSYPVSLSLGASWDPDLLYREAVQISDELREVFANNTQNLNVYAPTMNLSRDPRWGRNDETFSEDPWLTAALATQYVNGIEGKDQNGVPLPESGGYRKVGATLKHFAANNSESNRLAGSSNMDDRTLREYYTLAFRRVIAASHPGSIMTSYNAINAVPNSANVYLIDTLGRETFGFTGFYTSDCDAIWDMQAEQRWQPPGAAAPVDSFTRHAFANSAGVDLDCNQGYHDSYNYRNAIPFAVQSAPQTETGIYGENEVDVSALRVLATRFHLGEFDAEENVPWVSAARARVPLGSWINGAGNQAATETSERLALARSAAAQSIVLLENRSLPVSGGGVAPLLPLAVPSSGAYRLAVVGYYANLKPLFLGGYSSTQSGAGLAAEVTAFEGIGAALRALNPDAVVDFLPGLTDADLTTVDASSVQAAASYDAVVVVLGTDDRHSREDLDRSSLALPGAQADLAQQIAAQNPRTVVYLETVGMVDTAPFASSVGALLWSSYNGQRQGEALADVLFGNQNPSGHLPFTWYESEGELAPIEDYTLRASRTTRGRTYQYFTGSIAYPFGFGRSYTSFAASGLQVSVDGATLGGTAGQSVPANAHLQFSAQVTNTGTRAGAPVVQLYVSTPDATVSQQRPFERLVGFRKLTLEAGETENVSFDVAPFDLAFFDQDTGRFGLDAERHVFTLGFSSAAADAQQSLGLQLSGVLDAVPSVVSVKPALPEDDAAGIEKRLIFPRNALVAPRLTVALGDDSLFGYISAGKSVPLPGDLQVTYASNREDIVSIDAAGAL